MDKLSLRKRGIEKVILENLYFQASEAEVYLRRIAQKTDWMLLPTPEVLTKIQKAIYPEMAKIAARQVLNRHSRRMLPKADIKRVISTTLTSASKITGENLSKESLKYMANLLEGTLEKYIQALLPQAPKGKSPLETSREWLLTIDRLARKLGKPAEVLISQQDFQDQVTREMYTKRQYLAILARAQKTLSVKTMKEMTFRPLLKEILKNFPPSKHRWATRNFARDFNIEIMPKIRAYVSVARKETKVFIETEVARIYDSQE